MGPDGISGSGTTGYLPRFTGSDTVGNSGVYDDSSGVGIGTAAPHDTAILELRSTSQGLLLPRMTSAQRLAISSPPAGLLVFDTTRAEFIGYDGSSWRSLSTGPLFLEEFDGSSGAFTETAQPFGDPLGCGHPEFVTFSNNGAEEVISMGCYDEASLTVDLGLPAGSYEITVVWRTGPDPSSFTSCDPHTNFDTAFGADCVNPTRLIAVDGALLHEVSGQLTDYSETTVVTHVGSIGTLTFAVGTAGTSTPYVTYVDSVEVNAL